jgi:hypothetical protein
VDQRQRRAGASRHVRVGGESRDCFALSRFGRAWDEKFCWHTLGTSKNIWADVTEEAQQSYTRAKNSSFDPSSKQTISAVLGYACSKGWLPSTVPYRLKKKKKTHRLLVFA